MVSHIQPHSCLLLPLCKAGLTFPTPEVCGCHPRSAGGGQGQGEGEAAGLTREV